jgi:septum formation protein
VQILRAHGVEPRVVVPQVDEAAITAAWDGRDVSALVQRLALAKARAVAAGPDIPDVPAWVLAADTVVYCDGGLLGKPRDEDDAVGMLMRLMGRPHEVYTGVALIRLPAATPLQLCDRSQVHFGRYDEQTARAFVRAEQPYDKAGSYAIQGPWREHVTGIDGDFENVMGLPWYRIAPFVLT